MTENILTYDRSPLDGFKMTILSSQTIKKYQIVKPFYERSLHQETNLSWGISACGYDVRIAQDLNIPPGSFVLGSTLEYFTLPKNVMGACCDKSSWARRGIALQTTILEPGWCGYLTVEISNHSLRGYEIKKGTPIAQIVFHFLDEPTENPYEGKYQNQGPDPQEAR